MLQNNKVNLIISIIAALAIWAYVVVEINPDEDKTIKNVPVELKNVETLQERGLTIVSDQDYTVDVVIRGSRSEIAQVNAGDIEATADVFGYPKGENDVRVVVSVPDNVTREETNPPTIAIEVDELVTASKPIRLRYEGNFQENTEPGFVTVVPEEIEVSGARSAVKDVTHIEAVINSEDVEDRETTIEADAVPVNKKNNTVRGLQLSQDKISVTATLCHIKTVPLEVPMKGKVPEDYEVTSRQVPEEVTIKGVKNQLDKIDRLKAKTVNLNNIEETTEIPLRFNLPDRVELAEESQNISVIIEISGISVKDFTFDSTEIDLTNLADDYIGYINDTTVMISVYGEEGVINNLSKDDLRVYIDMSDADYETSVYEGTVKCDTDQSVNNISIRPEKLQVIINKTG